MKNIINFKYEAKEIRTVVGDDGELWWVLSDVCEALEIATPSNVKTRLVEDGLKDGIDSINIIDNLGRNQEVTIIDEGNLYDVISTSRKPAAKAFKKWVNREVLPSIRKTGSYSTDGGLPKLATATQAAKSIIDCFEFEGNQKKLNLNKLVENATGKNLLAMMGSVALICEKQERHLTASDLGKRIGLTAQKTNKLLESKGLIKAYRDAKNKLVWEPTPKGKEYTILKDTGKKRSNGTLVQQMFYLESIEQEL